MMKIALPLLLFLILNLNLSAQVPKDLSIAVNVTVQKSPTKITFTWTSLSGAADIKIYRRIKGDATWTLLTTLAGSATSYSDNAAAVGTEYEYQIAKNPTSGNVSALNYISSGIEVPAIEYRGVMLLVIDNNFKTSLATQINQLTTDLIGDGWKVKKTYVLKTDAVTSVKAKIKSEYQADAELKAVFLIGQVPVPYSGNYAPDNHPNHVGAWPADNYYGDINDIYWTDNSVNNTSAGRSANDNIPGDGKFDSDNVPYDYVVELQVGRLDLKNMPEFSSTELQLLKQYFTRNHNYKHKTTILPQRRALIDDNFGYSPESFATSGWRNFNALVGGSNVSEKDYFTTLNTQSYLLSYGCGAGNYTSCEGVGTTGKFDSTNVKTVFTLLFGSYFGDWDNQNNFLRAPLASNGWALTSIWCGRPYWIMHHMGMGENIGFSTRLTQNNIIDYNTPGNYAGGNQIALMGDPSLRLHIVSPISNLQATATAIGKNTLTWTAPGETVLGYYIYRLNSSTGKYDRLNSSIVSTLSYADNSAKAGMNNYMVRAVKLETGSGTYYNLSQGVLDSVVSVLGTGINDLSYDHHLTIFPVPATDNITVSFNTMEQSKIKLVLTDLLGKQIDLYENNMSPGSHNVNIATESLSGGIYFCELWADNTKRQVRKIIIAR